MSTQSARRLRQEDQQRTTMKARVAQFRRRALPCACHACQLRAVIQAAIAAGQVVQMQSIDTTGAAEHAAPDAPETPSSTKH